MNTLPKYWIVQQRTDPKFQKVIDYLNTLWQGYTGKDNDFWYGVDGNHQRNGTDWWKLASDFKNNPVQLSLDQFIKMTEEFVLPEKWGVYLNTNEQNGAKILKKWFLENGYSKHTLYNGDFYYHNYYAKSHPACYKLYDEHTLITFDQFLTHVVKKPFLFPEHWCIQWKTKNIFDKTCKHVKKGFGFVHGAWVTVDGQYSDNQPKDYTEITFQQFLEFVVKEPVVVKDVAVFDPLDWNIECKDVAQTQEVLQWISNTKTVQIDLTQWIGDHYQFLCYRPTYWAGNNSRNHSFPIEKSISWEQFQSLKKTKQPVKEQQISKKNLKHIHDNVCCDWQARILKAIAAEPFSDTVSFSDTTIEKGYSEANADQKAIILKYFVLPVTDKNVFIVSEKNSSAVNALSNQLFDQCDALQLLTSEGKGSIAPLKDRGFYVSGKYQVQTGPTDNGGTWISIFKK